MATDATGRVALITGGAGGIGAQVARRFAALGGLVMIADVDAERGEEIARATGGAFVRCDTSRLADDVDAVNATVERFGGVDIVFLNAGVGEGTFLTAEFEESRYRRTVGVNLDAVVYGVVAALPALRERGGGDVIATASLAGLTPFPLDPVYTATKHAVVGLVRSLGDAYHGDRIRINALCPAFADTTMVDDLRAWLDTTGIRLLTTDEVADAFLAMLDAKASGTCWFVQPGRPSEPFRFATVPGPR